MMKDAVERMALEEAGHADAVVERAMEDLSLIECRTIRRQIAETKAKASLTGHLTVVEEKKESLPVQTRDRKEAEEDDPWPDVPEAKGHSLDKRTADNIAKFNDMLKHDSLSSLKSLMHLPERAKLMFHRWSAEQNKHPKYRYVMKGGRCFVSGWFTFNLGGGLPPFEIETNEFLEIYTGQLTYTLSTDCALCLVDPEAPFEPMPYSVPDHIDGNKRDRIKWAALAVLPRLDYSKARNDLTLSNLIITKYKAYEADYPLLASEVSETVRSAWFENQYARYLDLAHVMWEEWMANRLKAHYHRRGAKKSIDTLINELVTRRNEFFGFDFLDTRVSLKSSGPFKNLADKIISYGMMAAGMTGLFFSGGLVAGAVSVASLWAGEYVWLAAPREPFTRRDAVREMANVAFSDQSVPSLIPCAKIRMKKTTMNPKTLNKEPPRGMRYVRKPELKEPEEFVERTVDVFGSTMEVNAVYPENNAQNAMGSMVMRYGFDKPGLDPAYVGNFIAYYMAEMGRLDFPDLSWITRDDNYRFLCSQYGIKRADELILLVDEVLTEKHLMYCIFVKGEVYLGKLASAFKPRSIAKCPDIVIAKFAVYWHHISKWIAGIFNSETDSYYASGGTPAVVGGYLANKIGARPYILEADWSNFDGSMANHDLRLEQEFHKRIKGMPDDYALIISRYDHIKAASRDYQFVVHRDFGRNSGDLWTSALNSFNNMMYLSFVTESNLRDGSSSFIVAGDDSVSSFDKPVDEEVVQRKFRDLGKTVTTQLHSDIYKSTFCSGRVWKVGSNDIWGLLPFRMFAKLGFNHRNLDKKLYKPLLLGIAKSLLTSCGHIPILGSFIRAIIKTGETWKVKARYDTRDENPYKFSGGVDFEPEQDTYDQFCDAYGIELEVVKDFEKWIELNIDIVDFPYLIRDHIFLEGFKVDLGIAEDTMEDMESTSLLVDMDEIDYYLNYVPVCEERFKLHGANTYMEAMENAYRFGLSEDVEFGTRTHTFLHCLFTSVSYVHFEWGVRLHSFYNKLALEAGEPSVVPCAKRKKTKTAQAKQAPAKQKEPSSSGLGKLVKKAVKEGLKAGGAFLGGSVGGPAGAVLGEALGARTSKWIGAGSYRNTNSLIKGSSRRSGVPERPHTVLREEYVGDIVSSTDFTVATFRVNPGIQGTFGWGSQLAKQYLQWKPKQLLFKYRSTSAEWSGSGVSLPTVMMKMQYDINAAPSVSKREIVDYYGAVCGKSSEDLIMGVECKAGLSPSNMYYVRESAVPSNGDPRDYDMGYFELGVVGGASAIEGEVIGELYVEYMIELHKPNTARNPWEGQFFCSSRYLVTANNPAGTLTSEADIGRLPITVTNPSNTLMRIAFDPVMDAGRYLIQYLVRGVAGTVTAPNVVTYSNLTPAGMMISHPATLTVLMTANLTNFGAGTNSTGLNSQTIVTIDGYSDTGSYLELGFAAVPLSSADAQIWVVALEETDDTD